MKKITNFIFELLNLKRFKHCGSKFAGVKNPYSLSDHSLVSSQIALILGELEGANAEKCALMCIIHDNPEIRILDHHAIAQKYLINRNESEKNAFYDQIKNLPQTLQLKYQQLFEEFNAQKTIESKIARDADLLEAAFQAKEYFDIGYKSCKNWIDNSKKLLKTKSAKALIKELEKTDHSDWWQKINISKNTKNEKYRKTN
ncbi:HD domain-containing protein [Patescibacteria group bacterium]|nr:HD domain-containing protein [Patescibacteria group bacterium]